MVDSSVPGERVSYYDQVTLEEHPHLHLVEPRTEPSDSYAILRP